MKNENTSYHSDDCAQINIDIYHLLIILRFTQWESYF